MNSLVPKSSNTGDNLGITAGPNSRNTCLELLYSFQKIVLLSPKELTIYFQGFFSIGLVTLVRHLGKRLRKKNLHPTEKKNTAKKTFILFFEDTIWIISCPVVCLLGWFYFISICISIYKRSPSFLKLRVLWHFFFHLLFEWERERWGNTSLMDLAHGSEKWISLSRQRMFIFHLTFDNMSSYVWRYKWI